MLLYDIAIAVEMVMVGSCLLLTVLVLLEHGGGLGGLVRFLVGSVALALAHGLRFELRMGLMLLDKVLLLLLRVLVLGPGFGGVMATTASLF